MQSDNPKVLTPPVNKPFDLAEIKAQANVTFNDDDLLLERYGEVAAARVESYTGRTLLETGYLWVLDSFFPDRCQDFYFQETPRGEPRRPVILFPKPPLLELEGIEIAGVNNFGLADILIDTINSRMMPANGCQWPTPNTDSLARIQINFKAGYGGSYEQIPVKIRHVINALAAYYYECREAFTAIPAKEMPEQFTDLLQEFRIQAF